MELLVNSFLSGIRALRIQLCSSEEAVVCPEFLSFGGILCGFANQETSVTNADHALK